jgi:lysophospholipase L1-like esterase
MTNAGVAGLDSGELLAQLTDPTSKTSDLVRLADIDVVTVGANDFQDQHGSITAGTSSGTGDHDCVQDELGQLQHNLSQILDQMKQLRHGEPTTVLVTGYWNVFEDGAVARNKFPAAGRQATQKLTTQTNTVIRNAARQQQVNYVDLLQPFHDDADQGDVTLLLAPDGDHPNARGHAVIAHELVAAGLPGLA